MQDFSEVFNSFHYESDEEQDSCSSMLLEYLQDRATGGNNQNSNQQVTATSESVYFTSGEQPGGGSLYAVTQDTDCPVIGAPETRDFTPPAQEHEDVASGTRFQISTDLGPIQTKTPDKPASVEGPDGSRIEFDIAPDGSIRAKSITHGDGSTTEYQWNKEGQLSEAVTKTKSGHTLVKIVATDNGVTISLAGQEEEYKNLKGELTVSETGNWCFKGKNHEWKSESRGGICGDIQKSSRRCRLQLVDGSVRMSLEINGAFQLKSTQLKDGTSIAYSFDRSGELTHVFEQRGSGFVEYVRNGKQWVKKTADQEVEGTLTLRDGAIPEFSEASQPLKTNDKLPPPEQLELANTYYMQQRLLP
ncbi:MAG: hypothetical protein K2Z81_26280, partial [Cyanobacteria bacterium]|nr:hypothetical protein [Cyanobacteriota bacterium]